MRSTIEIEAREPEKLRQVLDLSLNSNEKVSYAIEERDGKLVFNIETDELGPLRGCTDSVFRLTSLAKKLY